MTDTEVVKQVTTRSRQARRIVGPVPLVHVQPVTGNCSLASARYSMIIADFCWSPEQHVDSLVNGVLQKLESMSSEEWREESKPPAADQPPGEPDEALRREPARKKTPQPPSEPQPSHGADSEFREWYDSRESCAKARSGLQKRRSRGHETDDSADEKDSDTLSVDEEIKDAVPLWYQNLRSKVQARGGGKHVTVPSLPSMQSSERSEEHERAARPRFATAQALVGQSERRPAPSAPVSLPASSQLSDGTARPSGRPHDKHNWHRTTYAHTSTGSSQNSGERVLVATAPGVRR